MNKYERIKIFIMGVIATLSLLILINATTNKSILKLKELHIIDENDKTRIKMSVLNDISSLDFYDSFNNKRINLTQRSRDHTEFRMNASHNVFLRNDDHGARLSFYPQDKQSIDITSSMHRHFGGSKIELYNKENKKIWHVDSTEY